MQKPTKIVSIKFLTSDGCERCAKVHQRILDVGRKLNIGVSILKVDCLSDEGIQLGIKFGLSDVPSFVLDGRGFVGGDFSTKELMNALKKATEPFDWGNLT